MDSETFCEDCDVIREGVADGAETAAGRAALLASWPRSVAVVVYESARLCENCVARRREDAVCDEGERFSAAMEAEAEGRVRRRTVRPA